MSQKISDYAVTYLLLFVGFISKVMPTIKMRAKLGKMIGFILRSADYKRKIITFNNIAESMPEKSTSEINQIVKESYNNLGTTLVELLAFPSFSDADFRKYIEFENFELVNEVYNRGKGMILLSGHYGNWELLAFCVSKFSSIPMTVIVKPQKNKIADKYVNEYRSLGGNKMISMYNATRSLLSVIRSKECMGLLADQSANESTDIFVDFFGRPALTFTAPAALALRFDVPIIIGFAVRQSDCTYKVMVQEIKFDDLKNDENGVKELTQRHVKILENAIREHPHLWSWQHRRWKHQPK